MDRIHIKRKEKTPKGLVSQTPQDSPFVRPKIFDGGINRNTNLTSQTRVLRSRRFGIERMRDLDRESLARHDPVIAAVISRRRDDEV